MLTKIIILHIFRIQNNVNGFCDENIKKYFVRFLVLCFLSLTTYFRNIVSIIQLYRTKTINLFIGLSIFKFDISWHKQTFKLYNNAM